MIKELERVIPIKRAQMRVFISFESIDQVEKFKLDLKSQFEGEYSIENE